MPDGAGECEPESWLSWSDPGTSPSSDEVSCSEELAPRSTTVGASCAAPAVLPKSSFRLTGLAGLVGDGATVFTGIPLVVFFAGILLVRLVRAGAEASLSGDPDEDRASLECRRRARTLGAERALSW